MKGQSLNGKNVVCQRKEELLAYLYGECAPDEERSFKQHLHECSSCQQDMTEFGALRESLQNWQLEGSPRLFLNLAAEKPRSLRAIFAELAAALPGWFKYGTALAAACSVALLLLAVLNTQVRYDQNGFSFQVALFSSKNKIEENKAVDPAAIKRDLEATAHAMVAKIVSEKQAEIKQELEDQIAQLNRDLSEKNSAALSRATLELKTEQRDRLQEALQEMERHHRQLGNESEDDPFDLWGGLDSRPSRRMDGSFAGAN